MDPGKALLANLCLLNLAVTIRLTLLGAEGQQHLSVKVKKASLFVT
jgi:hypothetical protein